MKRHFNFLDDGFAAIGEELLAGFFDDETTKKPVVPAVVAPTPAKAPEVSTNEIVPAPLSVVPIENSVAPTDEKIAEQVPDLEVAADPAAVNEVNQVGLAAAEEILQPAASEIIVSEIPAVIAQTPVSPAETVAPVADDLSEEDDGPEGLIEGLVNTFTLEDGDGKIKLKRLT